MSMVGYNSLPFLALLAQRQQLMSQNLTYAEYSDHALIQITSMLLEQILSAYKSLHQSTSLVHYRMTIISGSVLEMLAVR